MVRVLVVDDDAAARGILCRWLVSWGYEVWEAVGAHAAIAMMEATPADILITDITMPIHDGVWLLQRVQQQWPSTVVIMASGAQSAETILDARRFGAQDFLPKPFGRELLRQALDRAATRQPAEAPAHEAGGWLKAWLKSETAQGPRT